MDKETNHKEARLCAEETKEKLTQVKECDPNLCVLSVPVGSFSGSLQLLSNRLCCISGSTQFLL